MEIRLLSPIFRDPQKGKGPSAMKGIWRRAFTLIELLIVVAIIAILAAIAIPNLLEAQVRAKVARVKSDIRTIAVGLEAYAVDQNAYPYFNPRYDHSYLLDIPVLTTPVAYLATMPMEVFRPQHVRQERQRYYRYYALEYWDRVFPDLRRRGWTWAVMSNAPDLDIDVDEAGAIDVLNGGYSVIYDPTNGAVSNGDIWATNRGTIGRS
jgi:prepilin-type N-terminal cleavage/methylation domain-containing protein